MSANRSHTFVQKVNVFGLWVNARYIKGYVHIYTNVSVEVRSDTRALRRFLSAETTHLPTHSHFLGIWRLTGSLGFRNHSKTACLCTNPRFEASRTSRLCANLISRGSKPAQLSSNPKFQDSKTPQLCTNPSPPSSKSVENINKLSACAQIQASRPRKHRACAQIRYSQNQNYAILVKSRIPRFETMAPVHRPKLRGHLARGSTARQNRTCALEVSRPVGSKSPAQTHSQMLKLNLLRQLLRISTASSQNAQTGLSDVTSAHIRGRGQLTKMFKLSVLRQLLFISAASPPKYSN